MIKIASNNEEGQSRQTCFQKQVSFGVPFARRDTNCVPEHRVSYGNSSGAPSSQSQSITSYSICAGKLHFCTLSITGPCILPWLQCKRSCIARTIPAKVLAEEQWGVAQKSKFNRYSLQKTQPHVMIGPPLWKLKCIKSLSQKEKKTFLTEAARTKTKNLFSLIGNSQERYFMVL